MSLQSKINERQRTALAAARPILHRCLYCGEVLMDHDQPSGCTAGPEWYTTIPRGVVVRRDQSIIDAQRR